eukprot:2007337-Amphidinium_carterae.1
MLSSTWPLICDTKEKVRHQSATPADAKAAGQYRLPNVSYVSTGLVPGIWRSQPAWPWSIPYALHTPDWKPNRTPTFPTSVSTGKMVLEPCFDQPENELDLGNQAITNHLDYRWNPSQQGDNQCALPAALGNWTGYRPQLNLEGRWRTEEM